ncbi:flagellar basal body rod protein FlgF [Glaciimonas sp. PAMC28666]|uniref:flagellar basal body rod protein FlgF n=1 Tax=Glaciimonas sp. PAMC28666 TaxID=2807626 RepID=UPI0019632876|nr:flagellar basal body rod protein FlgF [Glaciimonas sp. PAMC28666]QRX83142.1 flagellar basal body rod protein FlgF [Glaciimonas sp. PAMC28666]
MDRMIYIAMGGASQTLDQQASIASNMANVSTPGFRAQLNNFRSVPVVGSESPTRAFVVASTPGADMRNGPTTATGRSLDIAVNGDGWLAVQMPDGTEAYTRTGNLQVTADGQLTTMDLHPVIGEAGPIAIPPGSAVTITKDGLVSALGAGAALTDAATIGHLKLVNPPSADLVRGDDGLFRMRPDVATPAADPSVTLLTGTVEGSNVNPIESMVSMITNARRYEMQMKTISTAESNEQQANQLLTMT